jgi:hypothetical protein
MGQAIIPLLMQMGPGILGGLLNTGPPDKTTQTDQESFMKSFTESLQQSSGTKQFDRFDEAIEDPRFAAFRQGLLPKFEQEFENVQQPIFGDATRAGTLQDINEQFAGVSDRIAQQGAARGQLGSGLMPQMELQAELAGAGQRANFLGQLPLLEEQARRQATAGLLQQGSQFAGRAPISRRSTGVEQFDTTTTGQSTTEQEGTQSSTSVQSVAKVPWWQRALGGLTQSLGTEQGQQFGQQGLSQFANLFAPNNVQGHFPLNPTGNDFSITLPNVQFGG